MIVSLLFSLVNLREERDFLNEEKLIIEYKNKLEAHRAKLMGANVKLQSKIKKDLELNAYDDVIMRLDIILNEKVDKVKQLMTIRESLNELIEKKYANKSKLDVHYVYLYKKQLTLIDTLINRIEK